MSQNIFFYEIRQFVVNDYCIFWTCVKLPELSCFIVVGQFFILLYFYQFLFRRYILTKIGVLFLNENEDGTNINHISEQVGNLQLALCIIKITKNVWIRFIFKIFLMPCKVMHQFKIGPLLNNAFKCLTFFKMTIFIREYLVSHFHQKISF